MAKDTSTVAAGRKHAPSFVPLLEVFARRHQEKRKERLEAAGRFIEEFVALRKGLLVDREPEFSVLDLLSFGNNEVALSSLLAWFLDERKSHYHGNLFLATFVDACNLPLKPDVLSDYRVLTEYGVQEAIIDIMVYKRGEFLIYIENKILSAEGDDQTPREFRDMRRVGKSLRVPEESQFAVFLTPQGYPPSDRDRWHALSLKTLASAYVGLGDSLRSPKLLFLLGDLLKAANKWSG